MLWNVTNFAAEEYIHQECCFKMAYRGLIKVYVECLVQRQEMMGGGGEVMFCDKGHELDSHAKSMRQPPQPTAEHLAAEGGGGGLLMFSNNKYNRLSM